MSEKFGKYLLLKQIAIGGMGEIFLAQERGFGGVERTLVVKRLLPSLTTNEEFVDMFLDEGRIAAQLSHPNIVQLHEVGQVDGRYYIAMEYVDGLSLAELLFRMATAGTPPLPLDVALPIAHSLAAALSYAHGRTDQRGESLAVVHRDVTPQNVLLSRLGGVKLTDFGIATAANKVHVTTVGKVKGKLAYMAPEQARGERLDGRADVFALGILLYEMTTGVHPFLDAARFSGDSPDAVQALIKIITSPPPPPETHDPLYPNDLQALVMRCLEKDRDERPATAGIVERKLEDLMEARQIAPSGRALADLIARLCPPSNRPATMTGLVVVAKPGQGTVPMVEVPPGLSPPATMELQLEDAIEESTGEEIEAPATEATSAYGFERRAQLRVFGYALGAAALGAILTLGVLWAASWDAPTPTARPLRSTAPPLLPDASSLAVRPPPRPTEPDAGSTTMVVVEVDAATPTAPSPDGGETTGPTMDFTVPTPTAPRRPGSIAFRVYPWAYVSVDGQRRGQAPMPPVGVSAGNHHVMLRCGSEQKAFTVYVPPGGKRTVNHRFARCR